MGNQYADAINEATDAIFKGFRLARSEFECELWRAALERIEAIRNLHNCAPPSFKAGE